MATKKKAAKKGATKAVSLRWNPGWIKDPPVIFRNLDTVAQRQLATAKTNFTNQVKAILKRAG